MGRSDAIVNRGVKETPGRYGGIDSLRAVAAATVAFSHIGLFESAHSHSPYVPDIIIRILALLWNGPAAVIVFFIISGFCIHLPHRTSRPILLAPYLSRRLLRIGIPALAAIVLSIFGVRAYWILSAVLWSILCEVIYYTLYPLLRILKHRFGWPVMIGLTYAAGLAVALTHLALLVQNDNAYTGLGVAWTWLVGLPVWLIGCWLAEHVDSFPDIDQTKLWILRGSIIALSIVLRVVKFHVASPIASNVLTLNLFAIAACFWVGCEIRHFEHAKAWKPLEWAGTWSYSLYLVHPLVLPAFALIPVAGLEGMIAPFHFALLIISFPLAYLFYLIVERPSHVVALRVSRALQPVVPAQER